MHAPNAMCEDHRKMKKMKMEKIMLRRTLKTLTSFVNLFPKKQGSGYPAPWQQTLYNFPCFG